MAARTEDTILVVRESFVYAGGRVNKGQLVRVGHPLITGRESLFVPLVVDYDLDEPVAKPVGRHAGKSAAK